MADEQSNRIEEFFSEALNRPTGKSREEFLSASCGGDGTSRTRVEELLAAHDRLGDFLETPVVDTAEYDFALKDGLAFRKNPEIESADVLAILGTPQEPGELGDFHGYGVTELLGRGGAGIVFKARDRRLNRVIALKVLAPQWAANENSRKRFLREARAAAAIRHKHVVAIHAIDESASLPFLVIEYIAGETLHDRIKRDGQLPLDDVLRISRQVAAGLTAAHAERLVHRDIKPANILLERETGDAKITDFGLARIVDDIGITQDGVVAGTPQFMSPEQAQGHGVDFQSDLFSLGTVIYTMCAGRPPFQADSTMAVMRMICEEPPQPIGELRPETPPALQSLIGDLLEKDRAKRPQTAEEIAARLDGIASERDDRLSKSRRKSETTQTSRLIILGGSIAAVFAIVMAFAYSPRNSRENDASDDPRSTIPKSTVPSGKSILQPATTSQQRPRTVTISPQSDGTAADTNRDGVYDSVNTTGATLDVTIRMKASVLPNEVSLIEFDTRAIRSEKLVKATLDVFVTLAQYANGQSRFDVEIHAYEADGTVRSEDGSVQGVLVGRLKNHDMTKLGPLQIPLDVVGLRNLIAKGSHIGLRISMTRGDRFFLASRRDYRKDSAPVLKLSLQKDD